MIKRLSAIGLVLGLMLFGFAGVARAYAEIHPNNQTIYGTTATAHWSLLWSGGSRIIYFNADDGNGGKIINPRTNSTGMNYSYTYRNNTPTKTYYPYLRVNDYNDPLTIIGGDTARVFKQRTP